MTLCDLVDLDDYIIQGYITTFLYMTFYEIIAQHMLLLLYHLSKTGIKIYFEMQYFLGEKNVHLLHSYNYRIVISSSARHGHHQKFLNPLDDFIDGNKLILCTRICVSKIIISNFLLWKIPPIKIYLRYTYAP